MLIISVDAYEAAIQKVVGEIAKACAFGVQLSVATRGFDMSVRATLIRIGGGSPGVTAYVVTVMQNLVDRRDREESE